MKKSLATLIAGMALALGANASVVTYSNSTGLQTADFGVPDVPALQLGLNLFDSQLGTLTGVSLTLSADYLTSFTETNNGTSSSTFRVTSSTDFGFGSTLSWLDAYLLNYSTSSTAPLITLTKGPAGTQTLGAGASQTYGPYSATDSVIINLSAIAGFDLNSLIASVTSTQLDLTCSSASLTNTSTNGNFTATRTTSAGCGAQIAYTYTDAPPPSVPEPASLALMGLALAGLAGVSAGRRKS